DRHEHGHEPGGPDLADERADQPEQRRARDEEALGEQGVDPQRDPARRDAGVRDDGRAHPVLGLGRRSHPRTVVSATLSSRSLRLRRSSTISPASEVLCSWNTRRTSGLVATYWRIVFISSLLSRRSVSSGTSRLSSTERISRSRPGLSSALTSRPSAAS